MNKSSQKNKSYNSLAVNKIAEKYGYTPRYVRGCINGEFAGIMPDNVKKEYKEMSAEIEKTITKIQNQKI
jgi:hypothetical protein